MTKSLNEFYLEHNISCIVRAQHTYTLRLVQLIVIALSVASNDFRTCTLIHWFIKPNNNIRMIKTLDVCVFYIFLHDSIGWVALALDRVIQNICTLSIGLKQQIYLSVHSLRGEIDIILDKTIKTLSGWLLEIEWNFHEGQCHS